MTAAMPRKLSLPPQERVDGDLVGGVQHARRGAAGDRRGAREAEARERLVVDGLERQRADFGEVERAHRDVDAVGMVQRVGDRHAHVGMAEVRERRAVAQRDHAVDDRLRVHDDVDALVRRCRRGGSASMTSRPLFMSVAESIVILPPMSHVGCASASSTVTSASSARVRPRNGPPDAVSTSFSTVPGRSPASSWCSAECSESTGRICAPVRLGQRHDELAADDERLLVGQREVDPLAERRDRRAEAGRADERVEDEVGAGLEHEPHEPLGADEHLAVGPRLGRARARVGVGERDAVDAEAARLLDQRVRRALGADRPTSSSSGSRATMSSACVPIDPVEPRMRRRPGHVARHSRRRRGAPASAAGALRAAARC